jgi:hypothetical protein
MLALTGPILLDVQIAAASTVECQSHPPVILLWGISRIGPSRRFYLKERGVAHVDFLEFGRLRCHKPPEDD